MINLANQGDVCEEESRAHQVQRLTTFAIDALYFAQIPTGRMSTEHQSYSHGDLKCTRNLVPMGTNQENKSTNDQGSTDERENS